MARTTTAPTGPVDLKSLQKQVTALVNDLRGRLREPDQGERLAELKEEYARARAAGRTGGTFEAWLDDVFDQAAVAWVLGCVFLRFCEDNSLVDKLWLGGADPHASAERALRNRQAYLVENPLHNDRDWLRDAFGYLAGLRATGHLFDQRNPVWRFDISGEAAQELSEYFRAGAGAGSLRSESLDTRFLGDLYQDLSKHARDTYALLQTPEFVEEFILDRTFEPALAEFGLPEMKVIDPTCGSGHFLLGAFHRLVRRWREREPGTDVKVLVERALSQVTGVDINAFAVAVARFRLMIAALKECGLSSLEKAPAFAVRVAAGDSLLEWGERSSHQGDLIAYAEGGPAFAYATEDADVLAEYLTTGSYTVVVGNPPYITVKDKALNELYRRLYPSVCHRQYALSVPFAKRFFDLARRSDAHGDGAGRVGQITANSFMKREFGKKLIEEYFAHEVELTEVIDTSGAYIPGHGTPTVILVGRHNDRRRSPEVRAVLGVRGEPEQPSVPAKGRVWSAIVGQVDEPDSDSDWVSTADVGRARLSTHPWSLTGGGAADLADRLTAQAHVKLTDCISDIGSSVVTREDDAYILGANFLSRRQVPHQYSLPIVEGEATRDWGTTGVGCLWPYDEHSLLAISNPVIEGLLWPSRALLRERVAYGRTQLERGLRWFEYSMFFTTRFRDPSLTFADVATHNHVALDRGGKIFNRHSPVIKLAEGATEDEHLRLLGVLNSSTACFWLKQVSQDKGNRGGERSTARWEWEHFYEFTGTKLEQFPLPERYPLERARQLDRLAQRLAELMPGAVAAQGVPTRERLAAARTEYDAIRGRMIALQEELDWEVYQLYGLTDEAIVSKDAPELTLGERAFEIVLARRTAEGEAETEWFTRHGSTPITELPAHWSDECRSTVERRIAVIESDRNIALIERPECKRRWASEGWEVMQQAALRDWLLDRLEAPELWAGSPTPLSVAQLADRVRHDDDFRGVLDLWVGSTDHDLTRTLTKLLADEHVPFLPADRYKPEGLRKRAQWERTWELQRLEDKENKRIDIPVPPKYTSADFQKASYWRARGKLDVPKERFVSYPGMGRDADPTLLLGWAGWDHLAQARALAAVYLDRKTNAGWPAERLLPLLAGIAELEPWLHQWYTEPRPDFPGSPAGFLTSLVDTELAALGADREALRQLRGVEDLPVEVRS